MESARYRIQHGSLAISLGLIIRAMHFLFEPGAEKPPFEAIDVLRRRFFRLLDTDLENVERGYYPRELLFQFPYRDYARLLPDALADVPRIVSRRKQGNFSDLPAGIPADRYPSYYLRNFHWQTDGWFSDRSASLYDLSVEVLFQGTADIMRRMAIPHVVDAVRAARRAEGAKAVPRVLDIACGTGRFLHQLHRAIPDAKLYGLDLSPNYVAHAKKLLADVPDIALLAENAENIPLQDSSFDAVTSIYLFHELPKDARRNVVREAFRLLKPGGRIVIMDAAQPSESPSLQVFFDAFEWLYHEPYFKSYLRDDLGEMLREQGFKDISTSPHMFSKLVVGTKPGSPAELLS
jgi:ubiquinone/menaquinone biosynthesis C-methylase UbiE